MKDEYRAAVVALDAKRPDGTALPKKSPDGWTHLSDAVASLVAAWKVARDADYARTFEFCLSLSEPTSTDDPKFNKWLDALAIEIVETVSGMCADEHLITGFGLVGSTSEPVQIPSEWWQLQEPMPRFHSWSIDPNDPLATGDSQPCWIWVQTESLETQVARIENPDDPEKALPNARFDEGGTEFVAIEFVKAMDIARQCVHPNDERALLLKAFREGATKTLAAHMNRKIRGKEVESIPTWPIPPHLWQSLERPLKQRWLDGTFYLTSGHNEYELKGVHVDRTTLFQMLSNNGAAVRDPDGGWTMLVNDLVWSGFRPNRPIEDFLIPLPTDPIDSADGRKRAPGEEADLASGSAPVVVADSPRTELPTLPGSAKRNDHLHKDRAHDAAKLIRSEGISAQKAFAEVGVDDGTNRTPESIQRAIRRAFDLMYDKDGRPLGAN